MLSASLNERVDTMVDVFICVSSGNLNSDSGFALRDNWIRETDHIHSCGGKRVRFISKVHLRTLWNKHKWKNIEK